MAVELTNEEKLLFLREHLQAVSIELQEKTEEYERVKNALAVEQARVDAQLLLAQKDKSQSLGGTPHSSTD